MSELGHHHSHQHHEAASPEETKALLAYMLHHNEHHAGELRDIAAQVALDAARERICRAVDALGESNRLLAEALALLKEGE